MTERTAAPLPQQEDGRAGGGAAGSAPRDRDDARPAEEDGVGSGGGGGCADGHGPESGSLDADATMDDAAAVSAAPSAVAPASGGGGGGSSAQLAQPDSNAGASASTITRPGAVAVPGPARLRYSRPPQSSNAGARGDVDGGGDPSSAAITVDFAYVVDDGRGRDEAPAVEGTAIDAAETKRRRWQRCADRRLLLWCGLLGVVAAIVVGAMAGAGTFSGGEGGGSAAGAAQTQSPAPSPPAAAAPSPVPTTTRVDAAPPTTAPSSVPTECTASAKLLVDDEDGGSADDRLGASVSIDGDTAILGADGDDGSGFRGGAAYIFVRTGTASTADAGNSTSSGKARGTWVQQAKLTSGDGAVQDSFGRSVSVSGGTAVVGARYDDDNGSNSGAAYVFARRNDTDSWTERAKLLPDDGGAANAWFGFSVAVDGGTALVGARLDGTGGGGSGGVGAVYVFTRSDVDAWTVQQKLLPDEDASGGGEFFGYSVALDGDTSVVGAISRTGNDSNKDSSESGSGSAYVFVRTGETWTQQARLVPDDGDAGDEFGHSVALDGGTVVVGAWQDDDSGAGSGSAYVFTRTGNAWAQQAKLLPDDGSAEDEFGKSVAVSGDTAVVGARLDDGNDPTSGSAYVFTRTNATWTQQEKLLPDPGAFAVLFGTSVSLHNDTVLVGAPEDNANGPLSGSGYIFELC